MKRVMVDNWFLKEATERNEDGTRGNPKAYASLLMALVLWEEVCYPQNLNSLAWASREELSGCLCPIPDEPKKLQALSFWFLELFAADDGILDPYFDWSSDPESVVYASAMRYLMFSARHGCDYLPSSLRQAYLEAEDHSRHIKDLLPRMRLMGNLDEAALEYYKKSYEELLDFSELKLEMPVLADYIVANAPMGVSPLEYALHLRQEGPVIRYRAYLDRLEQALETQDWKELRCLLAASKEAVNQVLELDKKGLGSVTVKLLPTPSVVVNYGGVKAELGASPSLSAEHKPARRMHLSFLRELTDYAVNRRKLF